MLSASCATQIELVSAAQLAFASVATLVSMFGTGGHGVAVMCVGCSGQDSQDDVYERAGMSVDLPMKTVEPVMRAEGLRGARSTGWLAAATARVASSVNRASGQRWQDAALTVTTLLLTRDPKLREGRSAPRCARRAAHARRGIESKTESDVKTAQGRRLAKVARTLTVLGGGQRPRRC